MTGAQYVAPPPAGARRFVSARASRPIWLPVAAQRLRLKEQLVVIGSAKFVASACPTPCVASCHHVNGSRPTRENLLPAVIVRLIFSASDSRDTRSAARASSARDASQTGHAACASAQKDDAAAARAARSAAGAQRRQSDMAAEKRRTARKARMAKGGALRAPRKFTHTRAKGGCPRRRARVAAVLQLAAGVRVYVGTSVPLPPPLPPGSASRPNAAGCVGWAHPAGAGRGAVFRRRQAVCGWG